MSTSASNMPTGSTSLPPAGTTPAAFIASLDEHAMITNPQGSASANAEAARALTENGAPCYADASSALVDLFFKSVRGTSIDELFNSALNEADYAPERIVDLVVHAFYTRATRSQGKGEKELFYDQLILLAENPAIGVQTVLPVLSLIPHFGYYKDYLAILARKPPAAIANRCVTLLADALKADAAELALAAEQKRIPKLSLAGKWAPREGGKYDKADLRTPKAIAAALYGEANGSASLRKYRKLVSSLNAALNTTECLMAANRWAEIQFANVSSLCLARNRKAFLNEALKGSLRPHEQETGNRKPTDAQRVAARKALKAAIASKRNGVIKAKQLMPHEIVNKCMAHAEFMELLQGGFVEANDNPFSSSETELLDAQWAGLREGVVEALAAAAAERTAAIAAASAPTADALSSTADSLKAALPSGKHVDLGKLVPLVDVSGSMCGTPMEVAIALGILVSELNHPEFRDRVLTFETSPSWVDLSSCSSIGDKVRTLMRAGWGGSTDFAAACERILDAAQRAKLTPGEIPDIICFSDMQWNDAHDRGSSWETHLERLQRRFAEVGTAVCGEPYATPRIVFWNLRGSASGCPTTADAPNTQMLSGFSPALLKLVLSGADIVADEEEIEQPDGTMKVVRSGPTPLQTVRAALDDRAFDAVRLKLSELTEGPLKDYNFLMVNGDGFELVDVSSSEA